LPASAYELAERRFEFIPVWGFLVCVLYTMRRVECRRCGVVAVEEVPWGDGKRTLTKAYMLFLVRWARRLSWKQTANRQLKPAALPTGKELLGEGRPLLNCGRPARDFSNLISSLKMLLSGYIINTDKAPA
jgi:hypothetical protein